MSLRDVIDSIRRTPATTFASFRLDDGSGQDGSQGPEREFATEQTYFEIRLTQMYLQYDREYWRQFIPVASLMTQFLYAGSRRTVPLVVGPELIANVTPDTGGGPIEFRNVRVAGPYPYAGDDVELFVGLFRSATNDWARRSLSLLESVTKVFDSTKLSSFVNVADPLVTGIEQLLGMHDVELRMGMYRHLSTPGGNGADASQQLRPGYLVMINAPQEIRPEEQKKFRIQDGALWYAGDGRAAVEYRQADFVVVQFVPLTARPDYTTFDFHKVYWPKVVEQIWNGQEMPARQALRLLAANLVQCQDLTLPDRNRLLTMYRNRFDEEMANQRAFDAVGGQGFEAASAPLDEDDLRRAVQASTSAPTEDEPEAVLASLDF